MLIETLDYSVTIDGVCINAFVNANPETLGFADYSSAEDWVNGETHITPVYGVDPYLDKVESLINEGFIADHYMFSNGELVEAISEFERWDWTPEEGYIPWDIPEPAICPNKKQRRSTRRKQNAKHKKADRLHGKRSYVFYYKENGELKEAISGNEYRNWATWVRTMHSWGDPEGKKRRLPRTQSTNIHKDTKPVPEQEPTYVGFYGTLEVRKGITVTMEWNVPEAIQEEPI